MSVVWKQIMHWRHILFFTGSRSCQSNPNLNANLRVSEEKLINPAGRYIIITRTAEMEYVNVLDRLAFLLSGLFSVS